MTAISRFKRESCENSFRILIMVNRFRRRKERSEDFLKREQENAALANSIMSALYSSIHLREKPESSFEAFNDSTNTENGEECRDLNVARKEPENQTASADIYDDSYEFYENAVLKSRRKRTLRRNKAKTKGKYAVTNQNDAGFSKKISHVTLCKQRQKDHNKWENYISRKKNIALRLHKLNLRRKNEEFNTSSKNSAIKSRVEKYKAYTIDDKSTCLGIKTQDFLHLQYRELTPNDYELLLSLDEETPKELISEVDLKRIKTKLVPAWMRDDVCCICLQSLRETMKQLPTCGHCFHVSCIDTWLGTASNVCPIDQKIVIL